MAKIEDDPVSKGLTGLEALVSRSQDAKGGEKRRLPPVEQWHPEFCGDLDMEIKADGTWFYMGTPIGRKALVQLFSTVLRKDEDGETYLVTPVEMIRIRVVDAPFIAVEMNVHETKGEQVITFRTNMDDVVEVGSDNPLRYVVVEENDGLKPYVLVRGRLEAVLTRAVMYELISYGEEIVVDGKLMFALRSQGEVYPIMPADELKELSA